LLIYVPDFLSAGVLPDIFAQEDKDGISNSVKSDMKISWSSI
jgi:hypothetical protein